MNIGLFGDSYIDLIWHRHSGYTPLPEQKPWSWLLLEDLGAPALTSGLGGSNQFHAINQWHQYSSVCKFDYVIFTFTWANRLYSRFPNWQIIWSAATELRDFTDQERQILRDLSEEKINEIKTAFDLYYTYVNSNDQNEFIYELMVQYCLKLPDQFPDTRFIFIPNTEWARPITQRHFGKGVLLDFAFETLSNRETGSPGPMQVNCGRPGHLNPTNHERFKNLIKDIIQNYSRYENQVYSVDYDIFDISR